MLLLPALAPWSAQPANPQRITIDRTRRFQVIEGFGTAINTWHADVAAAYRREEFTDFYLNTLGASALRINLWSGVLTVAKDRWQEINWRDFRFDGEGAQGGITVDTARRLHAASKGHLCIVASVWSPPAWMKVNGSITNGHPGRKSIGLNLSSAIERGNWDRPASDDSGGERYRYIGRNKLRRDRYAHFAKYLVEWVRFFRSLGIRLHALSIANEPRFSHWFDSCIYAPDEYADLLETVARVFADEGESGVVFFGPETMAWDTVGNREYLAAMAKYPRALGVIDAVAAHGYVDGYASDLRHASVATLGTLARNYRKKSWITEGGFGGHEWPAPLHQLAIAFLYALRDGGISLLTPWQTLTRQPDEHGLMSLQGPTKKTYVAMQFWRFIRPGMVRVGLETGGRLDGVAFEDPACNTTVVVLLNRGQATAPIYLQLQQKNMASIDALFITDASRDCARMSERLYPHTLVIPPEAVVTAVLKNHRGC
jgi:glucuronoarabinoxylan endo-1,4-beta-xylanase